MVPERDASPDRQNSPRGIYLLIAHLKQSVKVRRLKQGLKMRVDGPFHQHTFGRVMAVCVCGALLKRGASCGNGGNRHATEAELREEHHACMHVLFTTLASLRLAGPCMASGLTGLTVATLLVFVPPPPAGDPPDLQHSSAGSDNGSGACSRGRWGHHGSK